MINIFPRIVVTGLGQRETWNVETETRCEARGAQLGEWLLHENRELFSKGASLEKYESSW